MHARVHQAYMHSTIITGGTLRRAHQGELHHAFHDTRQLCCAVFNLPWSSRLWQGLSEIGWFHLCLDYCLCVCVHVHNYHISYMWTDVPSFVSNFFLSVVLFILRAHCLQAELFTKTSKKVETKEKHRYFKLILVIAGVVSALLLIFLIIILWKTGSFE